MTQPTRHTLYHRIREILDSARAGVARSVNTVQVCANWLIGREIVEEEQKGKKRARYGEALLKDLSRRLSTDVGKGWSVRNLEYCRAFYLEYPLLLGERNSNAVRSIVSLLSPVDDRQISNAVRAESWQPGRLHPNLSWTHYRTLLRVDKTDARSLRNRGHQICLVGSRTGAAIHQFAVRTIGPEQG